MPGRAPRRPFGWLALGLCVGLIALVRALDPFGDRGMDNVVSALLAAALALGVLVAFARRRSPRQRLVLSGALVLVAAAALTLLRVEGVSAEMVPELAWRFGARPPAAAPAEPGRLVLAAPAPSDFPGFLGARRDNAVPAARLARDWSTRPPQRLWQAPIGAGWSAFAVAGGHLFTLEQDAEAQRASARSAASGALGWSTELDESFEHVLGGDGPRATPWVELEEGGGRVYALTAWGKLACLDAASGAILWHHDLLAEHGLTRAEERERAQYGRSASPLVVGELVVVPAGGTGARGAGLVAFDKRSGALRWRSPPRHFSHSSPAYAELAGVAQILCVNEDSLSAHAPQDGRILWEHPWPGTTSGDANVSQPVPVPPASVLISKGYGGGALLLALEPGAEGTLAPRELWRDGRVLRTKLTNVVVHSGFVYGLDDGMLVCVELTSGARRWKDGRYGHGQILLAGELLLVMSEEGEVFLLEPDPERPNAVLASFQGLSGKSWAHLALADGVLYLRNAEECAAWALPRAP